MSIVERNAGTLSEVLAFAKEIRQLWNPTRKEAEELWFRGQSKRAYRLQPGLYRPHVTKYKYSEYTLVTAFASLASPYVTSRPASDWEWYFLAQHYRLPTRLLDWTESLLAAVFFAIAEHVELIDRPTLEHLLLQPKKSPIHDEGAPAVWMMDAGSLNLWSSGQDVLFDPLDDDIKSYLWSEYHKATGNDKPIAIHPPRQNPRIVAQQGMFTVHGRMSESIDEICETADPDGKLHLACIVLDRSNIASVWDELKVAGVSRLALFPDLDNVAEHVKWVYQNHP
jgi:hypothetical protein